MYKYNEIEAMQTFKVKKNVTYVTCFSPQNVKENAYSINLPSV